MRSPMFCSQRKITQFLQHNAQWINGRLAYYHENPGLPELTFHNGTRLFLLGKPYEISAESGSKRAVVLAEQQIHFTKPDYKTGDEVSALSRWYRQWAEAYFSERVQTLHTNAAIELPQFVCKVRKMKRQWGNCSRKAEIKFNLNLIQYPEDCIDYVIYHEMSHLLHFNHSRAFYNVLETLCPEWRSLKHKLETFSP